MPFVTRTKSLIVVLASLSSATAALAEDPAGKPPTTRESVTLAPEKVTAPADSKRGFEQYRVAPEDRAGQAPDPAKMLRGVPGANFNNNGPLSGQAQYRGMFGPRMNVRIDGTTISPGGPNWMDPPMHYAPRAMVDAVELERGVSSVAAGAEAIGGTVRVETRASAFTETEALVPQGFLSGGLRSADDGFAGGGFIGLANDTHRFHVVGGGSLGDDVAFDAADDREIVPTEHERTYYGFGYGLRFAEEQEVSFDFRHHDTDNTGNPALPMDIRFFDTDRLELAYDGALGDAAVSAKVFYADVEHGMDNFTLRTPPDFGGGGPPRFFGGPDRRFVEARAETLGIELEGAFPVADGELTLGTDLLLTEHNMEVFDPDSAFFAETFNDVSRDRYSVFGEWSRPFAERWHLTAGARYTRVAMEAGRGTAPPLPPAQRLEASFNGADRDRSEDLFDWSVALERDLSETLTLELGASRKSRAPSYIERFAWLPIEATAGFADGNNHVGRLGLDPEVARTVDVGLDWRGAGFYFTPRGFFRHVDDYIQGTPTTDRDTVDVSTVNGDPTPLRYSNVEATFAGADAGYGFRIDPRLRFDGTVSFVHARRRDIDDGIFRVAPVNGTAALTYEGEGWSATAETVWAGAQDNVSATNGEPPTDGYAILNLFGRVSPEPGLTLQAGVENVLDTVYRDHLAGFNRVRGSDVGGATAPPARQSNRIPGTGRSFFVRASYAW